MYIKMNKGFTLLEILIALFVFSIVTLLLVAGLRTIIDTQAATDSKAFRLGNLQMTLLLFSRDIEQAINRPIINAEGKEEDAFIGTPIACTFTHAGFANLTHSSLVRVKYSWDDKSFMRATWRALDQAPGAKPHWRRFLNEQVSYAHFQYLDIKGRWQDYWPVANTTEPTLPRGVRITLTLVNWGSITQTYVLPSNTADIPHEP